MRKCERTGVQYRVLSYVMAWVRSIRVVSGARYFLPLRCRTHRCSVEGGIEDRFAFADDDTFASTNDIFIIEFLVAVFVGRGEERGAQYAFVTTTHLNLDECIITQAYVGITDIRDFNER